MASRTDQMDWEETLYLPSWALDESSDGHTSREPTDAGSEEDDGIHDEDGPLGAPSAGPSLPSQSPAESGYSRESSTAASDSGAYTAVDASDVETLCQSPAELDNLNEASAVVANGSSRDSKRIDTLDAEAETDDDLPQRTMSLECPSATPSVVSEGHAVHSARMSTCHSRPGPTPDGTEWDDEEEPDAEGESDDEHPPNGAHLEEEVKLFYVQRNATRNYQVTRYIGAEVKPWKKLRKEPAALLEGEELRVGDLVKVHSKTNDPMLVAEIAEIRDLNDGRHLLRIFYFVRRLPALALIGAEDNPELIPSYFRWVKSAHTAIIMWDCVERLLEPDERKRAMTHKALHYVSEHRARLCPKNSTLLKWTNVRRL